MTETREGAKECKVTKKEKRKETAPLVLKASDWIRRLLMFLEREHRRFEWNYLVVFRIPPFFHVVREYGFWRLVI